MYIIMFFRDFRMYQKPTLRKKQNKRPFLTGTLPETNSSPLKMHGWKMMFLLGPGLFSGASC